MTTANFNSIKVRLNQNEVARNEQLAQLFQFHKGTIKPCFDFEVDLTEPYAFQFHKGTIKPRSCHLEQKVFSEFQFHKGTIKPNHCY